MSWFEIRGRSTLMAQSSNSALRTRPLLSQYTIATRCMCLALFLTSGTGEAREFRPALHQSVRLAHEAAGCGSLDALWRIGLIVVRQGGDAALAQMPAEDCHLFKMFEGRVDEAKQGAVCIMAPGQKRCLWFISAALSPAPAH